jgi:predicted membrane-bound spermidine synthase
MLDIVLLGAAAVLVVLVVAEVVSLRSRPREEQKRLYYGPVVFGVIGCASGVAAAMLFRYDAQFDRVHIGDSVPLAVVGIIAGVLVGRIFKLLHQRYQRLRGCIEVLATSLLLASVGTVLGWLCGDKREGNPPVEMIWGLFGGMGVGAGFGVLSLIRDRMRS